MAGCAVVRDSIDGNVSGRPLAAGGSLAAKCGLKILRGSFAFARQFLESLGLAGNVVAPQ